MCNFVGLFWDQRTGKTITSTYIANHFNKVIILCLAGQNKNWVNHFKEHTDFKIISIQKDNKDNRKNKYSDFENSTQKTVLIVSMNTLSIDTTNQLLENVYFQLAIIDEAHKIKNTKTRIYQEIKKILNNCWKVIALTATPASKNQNEIVNLIGLYDPTGLNKTFLTHYYFELVWNDFAKTSFIGSLKQEKENEWVEFLNIYFHKLKQSEALVWKKEPTSGVVYLYMTLQQEEIYKRCLFDLELLLENNQVKQIQEVIAQLTYLKQISIDPKLINPYNEDGIKERWLKQFLQVYKGNGIIIFSTSTKLLKRLFNELKQYNPLLITGETNNKTQIANQFNNNKEHKILLGNIIAASKGITLDKADTSIFLDIDWRPDENLQAKERITDTTADSVKNKQIIYLQIANEFNSIKSIDYYVSEVNDKKLKEIEVLEIFKKLYKHIKGE